jgi:hypothetical protein
METSQHFLRQGDLSGRPEVGECYATATEEVLGNERLYNAHALLIKIGQDRPRTETRHVADALRREFDVREEEARISPPLP